jgi:uncharacterized UBP type Zn finger protein
MHGDAGLAERAMIRCREVARLLTSEQLRAQSRMKRLQVRLHLWMCQHCSRLARQIKQLGSAARAMAASTYAEKPGGDEEDLEARLLRKLSEKKQ